MSKNLSLAARIRKMKKGERFNLADKKERVLACQVIRALKDAGVLKFDVGTGSTDSGQYYVYAI